jgi:hypothetical protein
MLAYEEEEEKEQEEQEKEEEQEGRRSERASDCRSESALWGGTELDSDEGSKFGPLYF